MPAILNSVFNSSAFRQKQTRFVLIGVALTTILLFLWSSGGSPASSSPSNFGSSSRVQSNAELEYLNDLTKPALNITQWGEMGNRVQLLARWAEHIEKNNEDPTHFQTALNQQFPFLKGTEKSMFAPWNKPSTARKSSVGYVICTGSNNYRLAAHLITSLRNVHGVSRPIEIAYAGDADLQPQHRKFLQGLASGITFIDLLQYFPAAHNELVGSGWAMKPFSLLASNHSQSILVDADAIFLDSPDAIFDTNAGLARTGTLFFHDRAAIGGDDERRGFVKAQLEAAGRTPSNYLERESLFYSGAAWYEADSGVVVVDKTRANVLLGLIWATWMNTKEIREQVSYRVFYGDKETFWVAMELSGVDYFFQPWYAGTMGTIEDSAKSKSASEIANEALEICGTHMLHLDHDGNMPFWINGGIYEHKEDPTTGYMKMTHYWVGATQAIRDSQPQWYWRNGNTGCLREKNIKEIPAKIQHNIAKIIEEAKKIDQMA